MGSGVTSIVVDTMVGRRYVGLDVWRVGSGVGCRVGLGVVGLCVGALVGGFGNGLGGLTSGSGIAS